MQGEKTPRHRRPDGTPAYPVFNARVPPSLIDLVKAAAASRKVAYSVVVREALQQYVGEDERAG